MVIFARTGLLILTLALLSANAGLWVMVFLPLLNESAEMLPRLLIGIALIGLSGAVLSTIFARTLALRTSRGRVVSAPVLKREIHLLATVGKLAVRAGISMPQVAIFPGEPNAFCAGWGRRHALVAVSDGLMYSLDQEEISAVLAHEIAHIANGDMLTLELIQGVLNMFVVWPAFAMDVLSRCIQLQPSRRSCQGMAYRLTYFICMIIFGNLAGLLVAAFSRRRVYRADRDAGRLIYQRGKLGSALNRLATLRLPGLLGVLAPVGIVGGNIHVPFYSSHPDLGKRILALERP